jgi:hypothetical protein
MTATAAEHHLETAHQALGAAVAALELVLHQAEEAAAPNPAYLGALQEAALSAWMALEAVAAARKAGPG